MSTKRRLALAVLCLAPAAAFAQTAPAPAAGQHWRACAADRQKFCATVEKGKGLVHKCLESHASELSDGCKTSLAKHAAKAQDKAAQ
jgi:Cysteine rich repeat